MIITNTEIDLANAAETIHRKINGLHNQITNIDQPDQDQAWLLDKIGQLMTIYGDIAAQAQAIKDGTNGQEENDPSPATASNKILPGIFISLSLIGVVLISYANWPRPSAEEAVVTSYENSAASTPRLSPSPTDTVAYTDIDQLYFQVLNGSGIPGAAQEALKQLQQLGLTDGKVANADDFDHQVTKITFSSKVSPSSLEIIESTLTNSYQEIETSELKTQAEFDLVIVIGATK